MRKYLYLVVISLFAPVFAHAQSNALVVVPNAKINWCAYPGNGVPCSNYAPTYTSSTLQTQCPSNAPIVLQGSSTCQSSADNFGNLGVWARPGTYSYTLTVSGTSYGPFTVTLGSATTNAMYPVELFGAIGDWNGSSGTDNTAAIQACINYVGSLSNPVGYCQLQGAAYKISSALTIAKSGVGLVGVSAGFPTAGLLYPNPSPSQLVQTCASCDILDVSGTSNANTIAFNTFRNFTLSRSVLPTLTAKGLSLVYTDGVVVDGVSSQDSITDFYLKGIASQFLGRIENSAALWGFNGIPEIPAGSLYGFYIDSADGSTSNSLRLRNLGAASNFNHNGSVTSYCFYQNGTQLHDLHMMHPECAATDYGIYVNQTSGGIFQATDEHVVDPILDSCYITCLYVSNGATLANTSTLTVTGGWINTIGTATGPDIDLESASGVTINGSTLQWGTSTNGGIKVNNSSNIGLNSLNMAGTNSSYAVLLNSSNNVSVDALRALGINATTIVSLVSATNVTLTGDIISGSGVTNGFLIDSASHGVAGLETTTCSAVGGTIPNCIVDNGNNLVAVRGLQIISPSGAVDLLCSGNAPVFSSGFNAGSVTASASGSCAFFVTVGSGTAGSTGAITLPSAANGWNCSATNLTRADVIQPTTVTSTSVTFTNYGTTFAATNWTNGDQIQVSCFGR